MSNISQRLHGRTSDTIGALPPRGNPRVHFPSIFSMISPNSRCRDIISSLFGKLGLAEPRRHDILGALKYVYVLQLGQSIFPFYVGNGHVP